jgi:hypothetical protein
MRTGTEVRGEIMIIETSAAGSSIETFWLVAAFANCNSSVSFRR